MSYDLNILCMNQKEAIVELPRDIKIFAESQNKKPEDDPKFYINYCPFMNSVNGIWYYLTSAFDENSSFELCDINIDVNDDYVKNLYPFWHTKDDDIDVSIFTLRDKYKQDIIKTIDYFIKQSPVKTIIFHSRYQTYEEESEYIYGTLALDKFVNLLNDNKILFNTCYIVRDK